MDSLGGDGTRPATGSLACLRATLGTTLLWTSGAVAVPIAGVDRLAAALCAALACRAAIGILGRQSWVVVAACWLPLVVVGALPAAAAILVVLAFGPACALSRSASVSHLRRELVWALVLGAALQICRVPALQREMHRWAYELSRVFELPGERGPDYWLMAPWLVLLIYALSPGVGSTRALWRFRALGVVLWLIGFLVQPWWPWSALGVLPWATIAGLSSLMPRESAAVPLSASCSDTFGYITFVCAKRFNN